MNFAQFIVKFLYTREIEFSHINHFNCIPVVEFLEPSFVSSHE